MRQAVPSANRPSALRGRMWLAAALLAAATLPVHGQIWNQNLIVNGDAESGSGMSTIDPSKVVKTVPGWKTTGNFTVVQYGDSVGGIAPEDPGPVDRGNNYFAGGFGGATSSAAQTIDLSGGATEIDAGRVRFYLSGYLMIGSYVDSTRSPVLTATFKDGAGKVLLTSVVKGPTAAEGGDLQVRAISGFLLPNTRSVDLLLELTDPATGGRGDNFNLSSADNLALVLTLEAVTGHNLVVNGDAETSPAKDGSFDWTDPVPGWNAANAWNGAVYVDSYDDLSLTPTDPTAVNHGHLFVESAEALAQLTQTIDVTLDKDQIDAGAVTAHLSAQFGGDYRDTITAAVTAEFLDSTGKVLGNSKIGLATPDLGGVFGLNSRAADAQVPPLTRAIRVTLSFTEVENDSDGAWADNVSLVLSSAAAPLSLNAIFNAASGATGALAPGEEVSLATTGINLATTAGMQLDPNGLITATLSGVTVYFDGFKAPLLYVNSSQIGAMVPFELAGASSSVVHVEYQGVKSNNLTATVAAAAPGIFTQPPSGAAGLILDNQWQLVTAANPAPKGSTVTIVFTGAGQTTPAGIDGHMEDYSQAAPKQKIAVTIDGQPATLIYAGTMPFCWDGVMMAQVTVPSAAHTTAAVPVVIAVGSTSSPATAATMWVK